MISANFPLFLISDMKIGRNLARSLLEYYRFTNILPIPPLNEILSKRKGRPKTQRTNRKFKNIYPIRPKTTRENAPINYTDLSIYYDSDTSAEYSSPARYPFHSNFMLQHSRLRYHQGHLDPFSFSSLKLGNLELSPKTKKKSKTTTTASETYATKSDVVNTPPKPYLSIIDFNMLTRGGLEEATNRSPEKICPHHFQKLRAKTSLDKSSK
jgi:cytosolic carboxypeptidase protein 6